MKSLVKMPHPRAAFIKKIKDQGVLNPDRQATFKGLGVRAPLAAQGLSAMSDSLTLSAAPHAALYWETQMTRFAYAHGSSRYSAGDVAPRSVEEARVRLEAIARLMDSSFAIPGTSIRMGADAVLNLIPGLGLVATKGVSAYLIYEARRLGAPASLIARMMGNVGIDFVISSIPVVGWFGDVFFRANNKNIALLRRHLDERYPGSAIWEHPPGPTR